MSPLPEQGAPALIPVCFHPSSSFFLFYSQPPLSFPPSWAFCRAMFIVLLELPSLRVRRRLPAVFMLYLEFMPVQWHFTVAWPPIGATQVLSTRYILLPPYAWTSPTVAQHANEPYSSGSSFLWGWWGWNYSITSNLVLPLQSDLFLNGLLQFLSDSFFFNFSILFIFLLLSISVSFSVLPDFFHPSLFVDLLPTTWITGLHFLSVAELFLPCLVKLHTRWISASLSLG